jgi:hypothetical protein
LIEDFLAQSSFSLLYISKGGTLDASSSSGKSGSMDEPKKRRQPRIFKWSRIARQTILANLNASGPELRKLITEISQQTGNPRDACLRFARQLGVKAKQSYRRWTPEEHRKLENELEVHKVRKVAIRLRRTPTQIYGMMHRLGISGKKLTDKLSLYAVARSLCKHPQVVRQWIQSGALDAENEGTERVPRWMISQTDLQRFEKKHRKLIAASHVDRERLRFICGYVFPVSDELRTRESKKEREAYEEQMGEDSAI